jgi:hypothetical protein
MGKRQSLTNFMKIRNESGKTEFLEYEKQQTKKTEHTPSQKQALFVEFQAYVKQVLRATRSALSDAKPRNFSAVATVR